MTQMRTMVLVVAIGLLSGQQAGAVTSTDGTFDNADWATTKVLDTTPPSDATGTSVQVGAGGNPGQFRQTTHNWQASIPGVQIWFAHIKTNFSYDPAASAITSLTVSYDYESCRFQLHM